MTKLSVFLIFGYILLTIIPPTKQMKNEPDEYLNDQSELVAQSKNSKNMLNDKMIHKITNFNNADPIEKSYEKNLVYFIFVIIFFV